MIKEYFHLPIQELLCQRCNTDYPIWYCDHFLWNPVAEQIEKATNVPIHFLCLNCFAFCCEQIVLDGNPDCKIIWKLELGSQGDAKVFMNGD